MSASIREVFTFFNPAQRALLARVEAQLGRSLMVWVHFDEPNTDSRLTALFRRVDPTGSKLFCEHLQAQELGYDYEGPFCLINLSPSIFHSENLDLSLIAYLRGKLPDYPIESQRNYSSDFVIVGCGREADIMETLEDLISVCAAEAAEMAAQAPYIGPRRGAVSG